MLRLREEISNLRDWHKLLQQDMYSTRIMYQTIIGQIQDVPWKCMMYGNVARCKTIHTLWMACHKKLPTKERLTRFKLLNNNLCGFCREVETVDHPFYECLSISDI